MKAKGLLLAVLGLTGCEDLGGPDGKKGVLFFRGGDASLAEGLETEASIPSHVTLSPDKDDLTLAGEKFEYDFAGTTLEVEPAPGITVARTELRRGSDNRLEHAFTYRCEPGSAGVHELRVNVRKDSEVRYADAFDVTCGGKAASFTLGSPVAVGDMVTRNTPRFVVGSELVMNLTALKTAEGSVLGGSGPVQLVDPRGLARLAGDSATARAGGIVTLHMLKPGSGADVQVRFAGVEAPVPTEVVEDAAWTLALTVTKEPDSTSWEVEARPVLASGEVLGGLRECVFEARPTAGSLVTQDENVCRMFIPTTTTEPGTVCVTARGKTACAEYKR